MPRAKNYSPEYKAKIVMEILGGTKTISEIGVREGISPKQLGNWRYEFTQNAHRAFSSARDERQARQAAQEAEEREMSLMAKIGQLTYECDWLKKKCEQAGALEQGGAPRQRKSKAVDKAAVRAAGVQQV